MLYWHFPPLPDLSKQNQDLPANQNTELQKTEKVFLERLPENRSFEIALKILAGVGAVVTILTGIANLFGFIFAYLPLISVLGAVVFVVSGLLYYFISLRPKIRRLTAENESLKEAKTEIALLENPEYKSALESLEIEHQAKIKSLQSVWQGKLDYMNSQIIQTNAVCDEVSFLLDSVREQKENINDYVILSRFFFWRIDVEDFPVPIIIFRIRVFNQSVFDVTLENKIDGYIEFQNHRFLEGKSFFEPLEVIKRADYKWFDFKQPLSTADFELIKGKMDKNEFRTSDFDISRLVLTIKGADKFPQVNPKQVRIDRHSRVWNYKDYQKAIEPYSHI